MGRGQQAAEDILRAVPYAYPARVASGDFEELEGAGLVLICGGWRSVREKLGCNCLSGTPQCTPR